MISGFSGDDEKDLEFLRSIRVALAIAVNVVGIKMSQIAQDTSVSKVILARFMHTPNFDRLARIRRSEEILVVGRYCAKSLLEWEHYIQYQHFIDPILEKMGVSEEKTRSQLGQASSVRLREGFRKGIFISYRREDTQHIAGRLFDRLTQQVRESEIFFDTASIFFGENFKERLERELDECAIVLALIGANWKNREWRRSKFLRPFVKEKTDFVQIEIEIALKIGIPVFPILVDDTLMPQKSDLPKQIAEICNLNTAPLRSGKDFNSDMSYIVEELKSRLIII